MNNLADDKFNPQQFFIEYANTYLHGDVLDKAEDIAPKILFLHDENRSSHRGNFQLLRQLLLNRYGLSSCAFDFIGHGVTSGDWDTTSLKERTEQTLDIVNSSFDCQPFSIVATGLSAFTALKMLSLAAVTNLVLISPILPHSNASSVAFGKLVREDFGGRIDNRKQIETLITFLEFHGNVATISPVKSNGEINKIIDHYIEALPESSSKLMDFANSNPSSLADIALIISNACADS